jgi:hypothetical protein
VKPTTPGDNREFFYTAARTSALAVMAQSESESASNNSHFGFKILNLPFWKHSKPLSGISAVRCATGTPDTRLDIAVMPHFGRQNHAEQWVDVFVTMPPA